MREIKCYRSWSMPNSCTYSIPVIDAWIRRWWTPELVSVDPMSRDSMFGTYRNDLNPATCADHHLEAREFLELMVSNGVVADLILFDPPYSPRQISDCYKSAGLTVTMETTQNGRFIKECRALIEKLCRPGTICLQFGWNTSMMGKNWSLDEVLLVSHGGCHNDTICRKETYLGDPQSELWGCL